MTKRRMVLTVTGLGDNGPWVCNFQHIEQALDFLGNTEFGIWHLQNGDMSELYFGPRQTHWSHPAFLIVSYTEMIDAIRETYNEFGYEELYLTFSFAKTNLETGEEKFLWAIEPTEEVDAMRDIMKENGFSEHSIHIRL